MDDTNDLMTRLSSLNPDQLKEVEARVKALRSNESPSASSDPDQVMVYDAVGTILRDLGHPVIPPLKTLRSMAGSDWKVGVVALMGIVRDCEPAGRSEKIKAVRILVKMVIRRMGKLNIPVTPKTLAQNLKKVPAIVDLQFPGYRECGLLRVLLRKFSAEPVEVG